MSGAIPLLPAYVFVASRGAPVRFPLSRIAVLLYIRAGSNRRCGKVLSVEVTWVVLLTKYPTSEEG
jgi:hypothetical protein